MLLYKITLVFLITAAVLFIASACRDNPQPEDNPLPDKDDKLVYKKITPDEALSMMGMEDVVILDVRTQEEFDEGYIKNAILLPDYEIIDKAETVLPDKDKTILVYCRTGRRSETASKQLIDMGYRNVYDFGGIVDWTGDIEKNALLEETAKELSNN